MPDASSEEAERELDERVERDAQREADAEPEHQERSAMEKLAALRERFGRSAYPEADAALEAENADLCSKLEAAEGRIERARRALEGVVEWFEGEPWLTGGDSPSTCQEVADALANLSEPANAEGIASEGGSAKAANPREAGSDAPSAEAGQSVRVPVDEPRPEGCICGPSPCHLPVEWRDGTPTIPADRACPVHGLRADAPTGGGAEERFWEDRYRTQHRTLHRCEDKLAAWRTLAGELTGELKRARLELLDKGSHITTAPSKALARYHAAVAQHGEEER